MSSKRVFVAIDLSEEAVKAAASYMDRLKRQFPQVKARWIPRQNLHVTLHFVGNVDHHGLADVEGRVSTVAGSFQRPMVTLEKTGAFIRRKSRSNVLWLGITSRSADGRDGILVEMMDALTGHSSGMANARHPHLTIARLADKNTAGDLVKEHLALRFGPFSFGVSEIVIYESRLTPTGSIYTPLSRHPLLL